MAGFDAELALGADGAVGDYVAVLVRRIFVVNDEGDSAEPAFRRAETLFATQH